MSKTMLCPCCGREAKGKRARRVKKWGEDAAAIDAALHKLQQFAGQRLWEQEELARGLAEEKATAEKFRKEMQETIWGGGPVPAPGWREVPPKDVLLKDPPEGMRTFKYIPTTSTDKLPQEQAHRRRDLRSKALQTVRRRKREREYARDYYHKNKHRIETNRKARLAKSKAIAEQRGKNGHKPNNLSN